MGVCAVCNGVDELGVGAACRVKMGVGRGGQKFGMGRFLVVSNE